MAANVAAPLSKIEFQAALDEKLMKLLVSDLHKARPAIYWLDLLGSALFGWACVLGATFSSVKPLVLVLLIVGAVAGLYRALCFIHEISHQNKRTLPGFEATYNLLVGFPMLMPSFMYVGVHQYHHRVDVYGTEGDPEYLPFSRSWLMTSAFGLQSLLIPVLLLVRFLVLAPVSLLTPAFRRWLVVYFSSLTMNPKFRRPATPDLEARIQRDSVAIFALWTVAILCAIEGFLPWRGFAVWLAISAVVSFANAMRTLGAHAYESNGEPMNREAQLRDSIDTPGAFWTELWAPVGLRYHALHHYFPGIPYHNLAEAYRRVMQCHPVCYAYREMSSPSLPHSLRELLRRGWSKL